MQYALNTAGGSSTAWAGGVFNLLKLDRTQNSKEKKEKTRKQS